MKVLSGTELVEFIKERQIKQVRNLRQTWKVIPKLRIIHTADNPVIDTYVRLKHHYADDILIEVDVRVVDSDQVEAEVQRANQDKAIHGIIVQLPLQDSTYTDQALMGIAPEKDVDGLTTASLFDPATPMAINWLAAGYNIPLESRHIAIVGAGRLVGAPLARLWRQSGYDVTVYDESTKDLETVLPRHDLIVTATGVPGLITSAMVRPDAIVIDAGTAVESGVVVGDVADEVRTRGDVTITPTIGGVGPLTIAALLDNVITAARRTADQPS